MLALFKHRMTLGIRAILKNWVTAVDDQWTWTTRDGRVYENVELVEMERAEVVLRHQFGAARLSIDLLSEESLKLLHETSAWLNRGGTPLFQVDDLPASSSSSHLRAEKDPVLRAA